MNQKQLENKHFHSSEKGCKILEEYKSKHTNIPTRVFCETHQVEICRCGWEWGWHYGTYSKQEFPQKFVKPQTEEQKKFYRELDELKKRRE